MQWTRVILWFTACLVSSACVAHGPDLPMRECKELTKSFFRQPRADMLRQFESKDFEEQYVIYLCGNQYIHPPVTSLAKPLAARGMVVAEKLQEKLKTSKGVLTTRDIAAVYQLMKRTGTYDAGQNPELMALLEAKAAQIETPTWKKIVDDMISEIRAPSAR